MTIYPSGALIANRYEVVQGPREKPSLAGGMGLVYLCVDHAENGRPVALKTFRPELLPDRAARDRFLREGTTWVELGKHPHIVRCHRVFKADIGPEVFFVLELIAAAEGKRDASLRSWLTPGKPLSVEQALLFALHIARGMRHATAKIPELVHRDLKPENLLIGREGLLRVTDFGLASMMQEVSDKLQIASEKENDEISLRKTQLTQGIVGTPLYMAPEQWDQTNVDLRADIYAFGCILFEMLAGHPAVQPGSIPALKQAHQSGQVMALPADLSIEVTALIRQCMAVRPEARYGTWSEVESVVENTYPAKRGISDKVVTGKNVPIELTSQAELQSEIPRLAGIERVTMGWSYNAMGISYLDIGRTEIAVTYFEKALKIARQEKERRLESTGLNHLGLAYSRVGKSEQAIELTKQALTAFREVGDREGEGVALGNLGNHYLHLGQSDKAANVFQQRLAIAREIGDRHGEGQALGNLGVAYRKLGDAARAIACFEQDLNITREIGDRHGQGIALGNLGIAYEQLGNIRQAIGLYEQHLAIAREIGDRHGEGQALGNLGTAYLQLGDARGAIGYHEQHLAIAREIGDRHGESAAVGNLGNAHLQLGDARGAIGYYEQDLAIAREIGDRFGEGIVLGNLGNAYRQLDNVDKAIEFYEQHLAITHEIGDRHGEGQALGNLGNAYFKLGDVSRAIRFYEQHLDVATEIGDMIGAANTSYNLASLLFQQGRKAEALRQAEYAGRTFTQVGHTKNTETAQKLADRIRASIAVFAPMD